MANNSEMEYEEDDNGLTFKKIGHYIKKAFPMTLIVMICCVLVFTAIYAAVLIGGQNSTKYVATQMTFSAPGMTTGLDPNGKQFDYQSLRNPSYVAQALADSSLGDVDAADVYGNISVIPVIEASVKDEIKKDSTVSLSGGTVIIDGTVYYPTRFQIDFRYSKLKKSNLSSGQAKTFLNNLIKVYQTKYLADYANTSTLTVKLDKTSDRQEFVIYAAAASVKLSRMSTFLAQRQMEYAGKRSAKYQKTFEDLQSELSGLQSSLSAINANIISDKTAYSYAAAKSALDTSKALYAANIKTYLESENTIDASGAPVGGKGKIPGLERQLYDFKLPILNVIKDGVITQTQYLESATYNAMQNLLLAYRDELSSLQIAEGDIDRKLIEFTDTTGGSDAGVIAAAEAEISNFVTEGNALVKSINDVTADIRIMALEDTIKQTLVADDFSDNPSIKTILITYVIVLIVSFFVGLIAHAVFLSVKRNKAARCAVASAKASIEESAAPAETVPAEAAVSAAAPETEAPKADKQPPKTK